MPHTFDIRFARSAGLAALLGAPTNSFRWSGTGSLSIDAHGISVAARRGLLSLLARNRTRRISTANLREVFREGDALRVEFATEETARASLRFWARDRDAAAQIVQLLPTSRTVEIEEQSTPGRFRLNWRAVILMTVALSLLAFALMASFYKQEAVPEAGTGAMVLPPTVTETSTGAVDAPAVASPAPASSTPTKLPAAGAVPSVLAPRARVREVVELVYSEPAELAPGFVDAPEERALTVPAESISFVTPQDDAPTTVFRVRVSTDGIVPIVPGMAAYAAARRELDLFLSESQEATGDASWWNVTTRIYTSRDSGDPALRPLLDSELAVSRAWRDYLSNYDIHGPDSDRAKASREFAQRLTNRTRQYVD